MTYSYSKFNIHHILLVFAVFFTILSCEKDKVGNNEPYIPITPYNDSNTVAAADDTICPGGIIYDSDCISDTLLSLWGMGDEELGYYSCDRDYDWYIDQANTGPASQNNCGPSSAAMAALWYDKNLAVTAEDARDMYLNEGGWWYTNNIIDFLDHYSVPCDVYAFSDYMQIVDLIRDGNIIILCLTTASIRYNDDPSVRIDRFYGYADGHFLVVKGVRFVDATIYFEIYDPNNWHARYTDNSEKGKNRHYRQEDITEAVTIWWDYLIVVYPDESKSKIGDTLYKPVDPSEIEHAWGR